METQYLLYLPLIFLALYVFTSRILHKLQNLPPTPFPSLPFIGHLYLLSKPFHRALSEISRRHGPVLFLRFGSRPVLLVSSPSAAEECFTKNDIVFANRPELLSGKYYGYNFTSLAWAPYGDHWRNLRRISSLEVLSSHRLQMLSHIRADEVRVLIRKLYRISTKNPNEMVETKSLLFGLAFNTITRMIAGKRYYSDDEVDSSAEAKMLHEIVRETTRLAPESSLLDFLPSMKWFGFKETEKMMTELQQKRDKFMQNIIEEHRRMTANNESIAAADEGCKKKNIIEVLLSLHETDPEYYTDETIRNLMLVLLQASTDTSSSTMEWAFSLLLDNPQVLKKAQIEIDNHVGDQRLIDESDLAKLSYLSCIINETFRMHPAAPLLIPHQSSKECTVGGFRIPRGTMLVVNVWAIHNDHKVWRDPDKFMPERFEGLEGARDGFRLMPFGAGRRKCPGEGLAVRLIGLVLGSLIQCFDWEKVSNEIINMAEGTGLTAPKVRPLSVRCRPRLVLQHFYSQI
uniref:Cytochrome P450 n=1 Tax=Nothapodytes nimmoniana TaxID=159386 RepID=A0A7L7RB82_NOTNI|nr:cytochrome P450 [Nothapodytes nimmoniana]